MKPLCRKVFAVASPIPELAPVTTATRFGASGVVIGTTLINVLNFRCVLQRLVQHDDRVSLRGRLLLPRTLSRLTQVSKRGQGPGQLNSE
ncbi:hypothetical protein BZL30_7384 [Mycobacterium kansasii]|uniref:Uncharacterized protein n=1 Tax=Mycobacterium kansasii TaxID=1768 RepID=A0A1V3WPF4_MYCKA|nr:hypothetical protein BZL30_7384 [Mycobacterium kansasii]